MSYQIDCLYLFAATQAGSNTLDPRHLPSKNSISLEVGEETKLLPDSAFGNSLCQTISKANYGLLKSPKKRTKCTQDSINQLMY